MNFISETKLFVGEFLKNRKAIGSVVRSSAFLARKMTSDPSFKDARVIVEFGPGLGCITEEIVQGMRPEATLTAFEINPDFYRELSERFKESRVRVLNISAVKSGEYFTESVDYIVSGIPLANLNIDEQKALFGEITKILSPKGVYVQFQYSLMSLKILKEHFRSVEVGFTAFNVPPAFVYVCRK